MPFFVIAREEQDQNNFYEKPIFPKQSHPVAKIASSQLASLINFKRHFASRDDVIAPRDDAFRHYEGRAGSK
jgi:hypothetical protein